MVLLGAILLALMTQPFVARASIEGRIAYDFLIGLVAVSVLFVVFRRPRERWIGVALALPAAALGVGLYAAPGPAALAAYHVAVAVFVSFAVVTIVRDVFRRHEIGIDDIVGAFCGYLLLGLAWGSLYALVEALAPGSFAVNADIRWQLDDVHLRRALFNYVSFATMASLGYSDVTTVAPLANLLSWLEVMTAQFYLAVVIAQIVGMKLARAVALERK